LPSLWERAPRSAKDISAALRLDPATLSPLLKRLEVLGYLTRQRSAADERRLVTELTDADRALRAAAERIPSAIVERLGMDLGHLLDLHEALIEVIAATDADPQDDLATGVEPGAAAS
jgi:DNA-binding MarR family transcriptional regulator